MSQCCVCSKCYLDLCSQKLQKYTKKIPTNALLMSQKGISMEFTKIVLILSNDNAAIKDDIFFWVILYEVIRPPHHRCNFLIIFQNPICI